MTRSLFHTYFITRSCNVLLLEEAEEEEEERRYQTGFLPIPVANGRAGSSDNLFSVRKPWFGSAVASNRLVYHLVACTP